VRRPSRRTAVYFFGLFICGGPDMAPALPQAADTRSGPGPALPLSAVYFFRLFICGGPDMAPALPQAAGNPRVCV
jgi:hypothetical protein